MKKIVLFILVLCIGKTYAQQHVNGYSTNRVNSSGNNRGKISNTNQNVNDDNYDQIRIIDSTEEIRADVLPYKSDPKIKNDRYYYWYLKNVIHSTQGGFNGQLLNGHYVAYYPDKNLKEEGDFKRGLKDGEWKTWNPQGDLTNVSSWNEGIAVLDSQQPFWKKIPLLNKKEKQPQNSRPADNQ